MWMSGPHDASDSFISSPSVLVIDGCCVYMKGIPRWLDEDFKSHFCCVGVCFCVCSISNCASAIEEPNRCSYAGTLKMVKVRFAFGEIPKVLVD